MTDFLAPDIDPDSAPFWAATREHRLTAQRCAACARYQFPPRPLCTSCHQPVTAWADLSGRGRLASWTETHHVTHPVFAARIPYLVAFVELDEQPGLMMYGNIRDIGSPLRVGLPVQACFEDVSAETTLVQWTARADS